MNILNFFKPVKTIDKDEVQEIIKDKKPDEFILLDVRQPKEYKRGHIPGAVLIPISELQDRLDQLNPKVPVIAYCAIGGRSRAAASILKDAGFSKPYNLKGGFKAWNGLTVDGPPETGMAYFAGVDKPEGILLLAWALEEGTRRFYEEMAGFISDTDAKKIYSQLEKAEKKHQDSITNLFHQITGTNPEEVTPFYTRYIPQDEMEQLMEGEMKLQEVVKWAHRHTLQEVLEYAIGLEAKLYDLYFRLKKKNPTGDLNKIYSTLASEEKQHIDYFIDLLEKNT